MIVYAHSIDLGLHHEIATEPFLAHTSVRGGERGGGRLQAIRGTVKDVCRWLVSPSVYVIEVVYIQACPVTDLQPLSRGLILNIAEVKFYCLE